MPVLTSNELVMLQPPTDEERHRRAMFLAAQIGRHSIALIRKCLDHCDTIDFGGGGAMKQRPELPNGDHYHATKEVAALSIWLMLAEQNDGGMPEWLKIFFADTWACADILFDKPTSKEVLNWYPPTRDLNETCQTAAMRMCHNLHVGETLDNAIILFTDVLMNAARARGEILNNALKKPLPELRRMIDEPVPA